MGWDLPTLATVDAITMFLVLISSKDYPFGGTR